MKKIISLLSLSLLVLFIILILAVKIISPGRIGQQLSKDLNFPHPTIIAHRGVSYEAPESTMMAYELAITYSVDFLEADLQRTKDGVIIVFHDDDLKRTSNASDLWPEKETYAISDFTFDELQQLDIGSWFNLQYPERSNPLYEGLSIITLHELIELAQQHHIGLYLETKSPDKYPGIEQDIIDILHQNQFEGLLVFQSFSLESLKAFKSIQPDTPRVLLINRDRAQAEGFKNIIDESYTLITGVGPVGYLGLPHNIGYAHRKGLIVHLYTINDTLQMRLFRYFGADGFFTDKPALANDLFR